eukprot:jgi/Botrbrau1/7416/Bobra.0112s0016.1
MGTWRWGLAMLVVFKVRDASVSGHFQIPWHSKLDEVHYLGNSELANTESPDKKGIGTEVTVVQSITMIKAS